MPTTVAWLYAPADNQVTMFDADKLFSRHGPHFLLWGARTQEPFRRDPRPSTRPKYHCLSSLCPKKANVKLAYLWIHLKSYRICRLRPITFWAIQRDALDSFTPHLGLDPELFRLDVAPSAKIIGVDGRELSPAEIDQLKAKIFSGNNRP